MLLTRAEFAQYWNNIRPGIADGDDAPIWAAERQFGPRHWFVCTKQIDVFALGSINTNNGRKEYWNWCKENLSDYPLCYSTSYGENTEWWGFSTQEDIVSWMLRWS